MQLRFLIDDAGQSRTQRAVLAAFASSLPASVEVIWCSALPRASCWRDAPAESAQRMAARMAALAPAADCVSVFLPGHVIPGEPGQWDGPALLENHAPSWTTLADLDIFTVENGSPLAIQFAQHCVANPDYQSCSSYVVGGLVSLPRWFAAAGFTSARSITQRPWYVASVAGRHQWLAWLRKGLQLNLITLDDVQADVRDGLVRPSLVEEAHALVTGAELPDGPDTSIDALFTFPELRLSEEQHAMLHSRALQERTLHNFKREERRKNAEVAAARSSAAPRKSRIPLRVRCVRLGRSIGKKLYRVGFRTAYFCYSVTLRPLIRGTDPNRPDS